MSKPLYLVHYGLSNPLLDRVASVGISTFAGECNSDLKVFTLHEIKSEAEAFFEIQSKRFESKEEAEKYFEALKAKAENTKAYVELEELKRGYTLNMVPENPDAPRTRMMVSAQHPDDLTPVVEELKSVSDDLALWRFKMGTRFLVIQTSSAEVMSKVVAMQSLKNSRLGVFFMETEQLAFFKPEVSEPQRPQLPVKAPKTVFAVPYFREPEGPSKEQQNLRVAAGGIQDIKPEIIISSSIPKELAPETAVLNFTDANTSLRFGYQTLPENIQALLLIYDPEKYRSEALSGAILDCALEYEREKQVHIGSLDAKKKTRLVFNGVNQSTIKNICQSINPYILIYVGRHEEIASLYQLKSPSLFDDIRSENSEIQKKALEKLLHDESASDIMNAILVKIRDLDLK